MCSNCGMKSTKYRKYIKECNANVSKSDLILLKENTRRVTGRKQKGCLSAKWHIENLKEEKHLRSLLVLWMSYH